MLLVDVSLLYLLFVVVRRLVATIALFCSIRLFICTTFFHPSFRLIKKSDSRLPTPDSRHIRYQISDNRQQATSNRQQEHINNQESKATNAKRGKAKENEAIRCLTKAKLKYLPILHSTE